MEEVMSKIEIQDAVIPISHKDEKKERNTRHSDYHLEVARLITKIKIQGIVISLLRELAEWVRKKYNP